MQSNNLASLVKDYVHEVGRWKCVWGVGERSGEGCCSLETLDKSRLALRREMALSKSSGGEENAYCGDGLP